MGTLIAILVILPVIGWTGASGHVYYELAAESKDNPDGAAAKMTRGDRARYSMRKGTGHLLHLVLGVVTFGGSWVWQRTWVKYQFARHGGFQGEDGPWNPGDEPGIAAEPQQAEPAPPGHPAGRDGTRPVSATPETVREVPSLRQDQHAAPPPQHVIANQDVPPVFVQLALYTSAFHPANEAEEIRFLRGLAAGLHYWGESFTGHADVMTGEWNMPPAFISGILETGEEVTEMSRMFAALVQRLLHLYQATRQAVADGTPLPNNAARWFDDPAA
jgi:hypothetical protein